MPTDSAAPARPPGPKRPPTPTRISAALARRIALGAQGLVDEPPTERAAVDRSHVRRVFRKVGVVQLDSVNVVARAHELTFHARLHHHDRSLPWRLQQDGEVFEYWGHEASLVPVEYQPLLRWRMAAAHEGAWSGLLRLAREQPHYVDGVLEEVRARGPLTPAELSDPGGRTSAWWGWNQGKQALEYLFWTGQVTARRRYPSFERVYDLPERMIPADVLALPTPAPEDARRELLALAGRFVGVGTANDLADYFRLNKVAARPLLADLDEDGRLVEADVEGWPQPAYLDPGARQPRRARGRALVAPFDSLVWYRERTERLFGFRLRVELYTPAAKRVHGYYVLPFLLGDRLVARVDLKADRKAGVLRTLATWGEDGIDERTVCVELRRALRHLAEWLGLDDVEIVARGDLGPTLRSTPEG
jgi:uncharacterized protein YcaQ